MRWIAAGAGRSAGGHLAWLVAAALVGFLVAFGGAGLGALPRDRFVLVHAVVTGGFLVAYARWARLKPADLCSNWPLGLALGALAAAFAVGFVLSQPASPGPHGLERAWSLLWLGLVYGAVDALLLTVLPVHCVWSMARRRAWLRRRTGWPAAGALSLAASAAVTAAYHLGFPEFRGPELVPPLIGNTAFALAYLLSASPLAPLAAHVALHVAAVLHAYATSIPLPPHA